MLAPGTEIEERPLPESCQDFIDEKKWRRVLELATFECFETLPDEMEHQPEEWRKFVCFHVQSGESQAVLPPGAYGQPEFQEFASILLRRALKPELVSEAIKRYVE